MKFGLIGPSYTAKSTAIADEECINLFVETIETPGAQTKWSYLWTPGLKTFAELPTSPTRGSLIITSRVFAIGGGTLYELHSDGTYTVRGTVVSDGKLAALTASNIQMFIVSAGHAYCYTLATDVMVEVTSLLVGTPIQADFCDGYFIVSFSGSNKYQFSNILDGTTWPGLYVNGVSVFADDIISIIVNHRELWVMGSQHIQPYQDSGSDNVFDASTGSFIEKGIVAAFGRNRVDNTIFWIDEDERGARCAWRASGYTPQRISTHAVETALSSYSTVSDMVTYSYQNNGHLFWVLYIPAADCSWVYDVSENLWHKRCAWDTSTATFGPHHSWNYVYAFGKHLVGDWASGKIFELSQDYLDDDGAAIRRLRRSPTIVSEMEFIYHAQLTLDVETGLGPQPPLTDGNGDPRPPQLMLRWSDDRGKTWSNEHILDCGYAGQFTVRAVIWKLGRSRYRVYEFSMTDPIPWTVVDGYLRLTNGT